MTPGHASARTLTPQEAANRDIVLELYDKMILNWDFEAGAHLLAETYVQHDPLVADGAEGLKTFIEAFRIARPEATTEIKRVFVDGPFVILHVHGRWTPDHAGVAIVEIYRVENGRVAEHWDVIQQIGEEAAHANSMF